MKKEKLTLRVLIENDRSFEEDFNPNQKVQVVINQLLANLKIDAEGRILRREDASVIDDYSQTIEEAGLTSGALLKYFKKAPGPGDRDKGFA